MKSQGIVRNIDELGRIVIPKEYRTQLGIANSDPVEMIMEGERVILTKYRSVCHFCGETDSLIDYRNKKICQKCASDISKSII